jgi:peroxiredoxin
MAGRNRRIIQPSPGSREPYHARFGGVKTAALLSSREGKGNKERAMIRAGASITLVLAVCLAVAGCGGSKEKPAPAEKAEAASQEKMAPDFALPDLDGKVVHLSDSAGKVRLVNFWATWCAPCREEIPTFKRLHETYGPRGLTVLAISSEGKDVVAPFVKENGIPYTNLVGDEDVDCAKADDKASNCSIGDKFGGLYGFPTTFLVDGNGKILESYIGMVPRKDLEEAVSKALGST